MPDVYCKHGFRLQTWGWSFVTLNDLENISILLDEGDDLEDEITHLLKKYFFVQVCKKNPTKNKEKKAWLGSKYIHNIYRNTA